MPGFEPSTSAFRNRHPNHMNSMLSLLKLVNVMKVSSSEICIHILHQVAVTFITANNGSMVNNVLKSTSEDMCHCGVMIVV